MKLFNVVQCRDLMIKLYQSIEISLIQINFTYFSKRAFNVKDNYIVIKELYIILNYIIIKESVKLYFS